MPTGERHARARQRGFTYVLLLFIVAACGVAAATLGTRWQTQAQREREAELVFRGMQLQDALQRYHDQTPDGQPRHPGSLDDLLLDTRGGAARHLLRQVYSDPFTGLPDWVLLRHEDGGIVGVHSRAQVPTLRRHGLPPGVGGAGALATTVDQWHFRIAADQAPGRQP